MPMRYTKKPRVARRPRYTRRAKRSMQSYLKVKRYSGIRKRPYTKISKQPIAERFFTQMRYSQVVSMTLATANVLYSHQWQTSLYDPYFTGVGHQPFYFDQLAALYNKYRVYGIKYKITAKTGAAVDLTSFYVKHNADTTLETNQDTLRERSEGRGRIMSGPQTGGRDMIMGYMSTYRPQGKTKKDFLADESFISAVTTSPATTSQLQLYAVTVGGSASVYFQVDLEFYAEWFDRIEVGGS